MKKLLLSLLLLTSHSAFTASYLDFSLSDFCFQDPTIEITEDFYHFINEEQGITATSICVYKDANGQYQSKGKLIDGRKHGKWTWWDENGKKKVEVNYNMGEERGENGSYIVRYMNGQKEYEQYYEDGKLNGERIYWDMNGQKRLVSNYINGKANGNWNYWYENGQNRGVEFYKDGKLVNQIIIKYYKNGQIESEKNFKNDRLYGKAIYWYENGQKFVEAYYKNDIKDGKWTIWKRNGQKDEVTNYKDGDLVDKTIFKYSFFTGRLKSEKKYKDGNCISGC